MIAVDGHNLLNVLVERHHKAAFLECGDMGAHAVGGYYSTNGSAMMRCSIKMRLGRYMLMGILVPFKFAGTEMVAWHSQL